MLVEKKYENNLRRNMTQEKRDSARILSAYFIKRSTTTTAKELRDGTLVGR